MTPTSEIWLLETETERAATTLKVLNARFKTVRHFSDVESLLNEWDSGNYPPLLIADEPADGPSFITALEQRAAAIPIYCGIILILDREAHAKRLETHSLAFERMDHPIFTPLDIAHVMFAISRTLKDRKEYMERDLYSRIAQVGFDRKHVELSQQLGRSASDDEVLAAQAEDEKKGPQALDRLFDNMRTACEGTTYKFSVLGQAPSTCTLTSSIPGLADILLDPNDPWARSETVSI